MTSAFLNWKLSKLLCAAGLVAYACWLAPGAATQTKKQTSAAPAKANLFVSPQVAADALIAAAENYDVAALQEILGPDSQDIIRTDEPARDREIASEFAARAREKKYVTIDPKSAA